MQGERLVPLGHRVVENVDLLLDGGDMDMALFARHLDALEVPGGEADDGVDRREVLARCCRSVSRCQNDQHGAVRGFVADRRRPHPDGQGT